jgi:hypothetical protein
MTGRKSSRLLLYIKEKNDDIINVKKQFKMKKTLILLLTTVVVSVTALQAQQMQTYSEIIDSMFQHVSRVDATTGILYERMMPFAGLQRFTPTNADTADADRFIQAFFELYGAAFLPSVRLPYDADSLEQQIG